MAVQARNPHLNPTAGAVKTPAPDQVTNIRSPGGAGAGQNGPQPSALAPGLQSLSPLAANLKASTDDGGMLDQVIARGAGHDDEVLNRQTREISDKAQPAAFGCHDPNKSDEKVPSRLGSAAGSPGDNADPMNLKGAMGFKPASLPDTVSNNASPPVRRP